MMRIVFIIRNMNIEIRERRLELNMREGLKDERISEATMTGEEGRGGRSIPKRYEKKRAASNYLYFDTSDFITNLTNGVFVAFCAHLTLFKMCSVL